MNQPEIRLLPLRGAIPVGETSDLDVLVRIVPPELPPDPQVERPPLNLALVLDRSGSMEGQKLFLAREAACNLVAQLGPRDRVSVVTFDDKVRCLVPSTPVRDVPALQKALRSVEAGGSTDLHGGWMEGSRQVLSHLEPRATNRVLVMTDGQANSGERDPGVLATRASQLSRKGISTTTLGLGDDYHEELLTAMARRGDGNFYHLEGPGQFQTFFALELDEHRRRMGRKVSLGVTPASGSKAEVLNLLELNRSGNHRLPNLLRGVTTDVVVRLRVQGADFECQHPLMVVRLAWDEASGKRREQHALLAVAAVPGGRLSEFPVDEEVLKAVIRIEIARLKREAAEALRQGDGGAAGSYLDQAWKRAGQMPASPERELELEDLAHLREHLEQGRLAAAQRASHFQEYQRSHGRSEYGGGRETRGRSDASPSGPHPGHSDSSHHSSHPGRADDSTRQVRELFDRGLLEAEDSDWLTRPVPPLEPEPDLDRVDGMLWGLAVGDSLGRPEGVPPQARRARYGDRRDYLPNSHTGLAMGYPSDDTQLAFWTVEHLLAHGGLEPGTLVRDFLAGGRVFGLGQTLKEVFRRVQAGVPWEQAGLRSAGNGALMRIAPVLLPHLLHPSPQLWSDALLAGMVTHNDRASNASCVAMVRILWDLLSMTAPPEPSWWVDAWVETARAVEGTTRYRSQAPRFAGWEGPLWRFVEEQVPAALARGLDDVDEAGWYSGPYLLETVPSVLFLLARYAHDPEEALVRAATDTWDNDTVAALVGAAVGALHGRSALPRRWVEKHTGCIRLGDEGAIPQLIRRVLNGFGGRG